MQPHYPPEESRVIYESKDERGEKVFEALEWLAAMGSHVPGKGESCSRRIRYFGYLIELTSIKHFQAVICNLFYRRNLKTCRCKASKMSPSM